MSTCIFQSRTAQHIQLHLSTRLKDIALLTYFYPCRSLDGEPAVARMSGRPIAPSFVRQTCKVISKRQFRAFSSTIRMDNRMVGQIMRQMRSTQSMDAMRRKMKRSDLPDDLGLVTNTFIMPAQLPPILSNDAGKATTKGLKQRFKKRYHLKWLFFKQKVTDFLL